MIIFYFKEAFKSIFHAKASFILTLITLSIAVILIAASVGAIQLSEIFENKLKKNVKLTLFLQDSVKQNSVTLCKEELQSLKFKNGVTFISKEKAAENFIKETGEDFREILDYNPLPASFIVELKTDFVTKDSVENIIADLQKYTWIDEVVSGNSFIYRVLKYVDESKQYLFIITVIILLISIYLVYSTTRLITENRMNELETMKLVGAKLSTIKIPIVINNIVAGIIAGIISVLIFELVNSEISNYQFLVNFVRVNKVFYYALLLILSPILSLSVTLFALRKLTLKI
jgi:cell division transport system permease protein